MQCNVEKDKYTLNHVNVLLFTTVNAEWMTVHVMPIHGALQTCTELQAEESAK